MERYDLVPQGLSAELIAERWEIPRSELDELGLRSQRLAARATEEGRFEREMIPFAVNGDTYVTDQGIRPDTTLEKLAALKPAFKEDGKVTAGNSSQISDGAAAVLLMTREKADALGLKPRARIVDQTTVGVDPVIMLTGPIPATRKLLERNAMTIATSTSSRSTRRSRPSSRRGSASSSRTWTASTSTAARWRSAMPSARRERGSSRRSCTRWSARTRSAAS